MSFKEGFNCLLQRRDNLCAFAGSGAGLGFAFQMSFTRRRISLRRNGWYRSLPIAPKSIYWQTICFEK